MTAASVGRGRTRVSADPPRLRLSWTMIGVIASMSTAAAGAVAAYGALRQDVADIHRELPPGAIGTLMKGQTDTENELRDLRQSLIRRGDIR